MASRGSSEANLASAVSAEAVSPRKKPSPIKNFLKGITPKTKRRQRPLPAGAAEAYKNPRPSSPVFLRKRSSTLPANERKMMKKKAKEAAEAADTVVLENGAVVDKLSGSPATFRSHRTSRLVHSSDENVADVNSTTDCDESLLGGLLEGPHRREADDEDEADDSYEDDDEDGEDGGQDRKRRRHRRREDGQKTNGAISSEAEEEAEASGGLKTPMIVLDDESLPEDVEAEAEAEAEAGIPISAGNGHLRNGVPADRADRADGPDRANEQKMLAMLQMLSSPEKQQDDVLDEMAVNGMSEVKQAEQDDGQGKKKSEKDQNSSSLLLCHLLLRARKQEKRITELEKALGKMNDGGDGDANQVTKRSPMGMLIRAAPVLAATLGAAALVLAKYK